jgi:hypothetical protein
MVLLYFGNFTWDALIFWMATHAIIDWGKAQNLTGNDKVDKWWLYADQILHVATIILIWSLYNGK